MNADKPLATVDTQEILDKLLSGQSVQQIANDLNITRIALYAWMLRNCPGQWLETQAAKQLSKLDECESVFDAEYSGDSRRDGIDISRTREKAKLAQWHLERANRKLFGDSKAEGAGKVQIVIQRLDSTDNVGVTICGDDRPTLPGSE